MTGPEHYQAAERLAHAARGTVYGEPVNHPDGTPIMDPEAGVYAAVGQVHATLALAAATALGRDPQHAPRVDRLAWQRVAGYPSGKGAVAASSDATSFAAAIRTATEEWLELGRAGEAHDARWHELYEKWCQAGGGNGLFASAAEAGTAGLMLTAIVDGLADKTMPARFPPGRPGDAEPGES